MTVHQTIEENRALKRRVMRERLVLWFVRWSQVIMAIAFLAAAGLFLFGLTAPEQIEALPVRILLYIAIGLSCLTAAAGFLVNGCICGINERMQRREENKNRTYVKLLNARRFENVECLRDVKGEAIALDSPAGRRRNAKNKAQ